MTTTVLDGQYPVLAYGHVDIENSYKQIYPSLDFLMEMSSGGQYASSARGYKALFKMYVDKGRQGLNSDLLHEANKNEGIYELIKGDLRLFCFFDSGKMVLTNGGIKKGRKVDPQDVSFAITAKKAYEAGKKCLK